MNYSDLLSATQWPLVTRKLATLGSDLQKLFVAHEDRCRSMEEGLKGEDHLTPRASAGECAIEDKGPTTRADGRNRQATKPSYLGIPQLTESWGTHSYPIIGSGAGSCSAVVSERRR